MLRIVKFPHALVYNYSEARSLNRYLDEWFSLIISFSLSLLQ